MQMLICPAGNESSSMRDPLSIEISNETRRRYSVQVRQAGLISFLRSRLITDC